MKAEPKQIHVAKDFAHGAPLINCRFDPNGTHVFATAEDRAIIRWTLSDGKKTEFKAHDSWVRGLAFPFGLVGPLALVGIYLYRRDAQGRSAAADLHVWFEADLLPGYAWSFPLPDGRANVGFGILRGGPVTVGATGRIWDKLMDRRAIRSVLGDHAVPEDRRMAWPIPAKVDRAVLDHGPVLFVGDAAAATDALTGEGIGQALLTGILAGEAVLAGSSPADVAEIYRRSVRRELVADHRMSTALQAILARPTGARAAVRLAGATPWTRRNFAPSTFSIP